MKSKDWDQLSFTLARHSEPPQPDFCLPNLVAGTVGVVAAPAGIGKTSLLMQIAASVAAGVPVAGGLLPAPAKTGRVVFLATEDPLAVLQRRAHCSRRLNIIEPLIDLITASCSRMFDSGCCYISADSSRESRISKGMCIVKSGA
jgi:RecA-family ATPase